MRRALLLLLVLALLAGCEEPTSNTSSQSKPGPPQPPQPPAKQTAHSQEPQEEQTERVKAEVGVGKKGRRLEKEGLVRLMTVPALTYFRTEQRVVFEIKIPHALQLYKALHGKAPKTEEAFMKEIIEANNIELPELPAGHRYVYDAERGELMVERPKSE
jgi:hypothetical protein